MEYISSDTNVWIDFQTIDRLELPFRLPYIYLMNGDSVEDELLNPPGLGEKLSAYDCIALAIAKVRKIILLTGDGPLRRTAAAEGVSVMGTIGLLDQLREGQYIDSDDYTDCIASLLRHNGREVRLPENELQKRLREK